MKKIFKLLALFTLAGFLASAGPGFAPVSPADAAAKKKAHRAKRRVRKARGGKSSWRIKKTDRLGRISQKYYLEEGFDGNESQKIIDGLKETGVAEASADVAANTLLVKFNSSSLSSISIIKKLKELGYSVKRID